jgi:succinate dehydrogenase / fumarate reductase flavoprotein subunit
LIVFGRLAGLGAAEYVKKLGSALSINNKDIDAAIEEMEEPFKRAENADAKNPYEVQKTLNQIMSTYVGIYRNKADLETGIAKLQTLKEDVKHVASKGSKVFNPGWHMCRDLKNMLIASEAIARSALSREESRGAHSREDFENLNPELGKFNTAISKDGDSMKLEKTPCPEMPEELKKLFAKKETTHNG